jgi:hypothetical protein
MLQNFLLSISAPAVSKLPSVELLQYLMLLSLGGVALLSKKQLKKANRKLKWQLLKDTVKNSFSKSGSNKTLIKNLLLILLGLAALLGVYALIGAGWTLGLLIVILLIMGAARTNSGHRR